MLSKLGKSRVLISLLSVVAIVVMYGSSWDLTLKRVGRLNSNLCGCQKCLTEGDPWFKELINASPEPFLSRKYTTAEETFDWWKGLQWESRNFAFYNKTVDDLFQTFPQSPDVVESSPDRCRTCAVVGNSGNLRRSHYGPLIDFHDIVIRMNRGRTKGYEAHVGTKTTHHVMYPESAVNLDNTTHLVLFAFKMNDLLWLLRKFNSGESNAVNSKRIANKDLVMILNPAFMKYAHEVWLGRKGRYPSTGFMALLFSMYICDEVNVFGFGADRDGNWNHYYEILRNKGLKTGPHPGKQEYEIIHQLHHTKKIVFYEGF